MNSLRDLFLLELAHVYDSEQQIARFLATLEKAASFRELKQILRAHLEKDTRHVIKLEKVFAILGETPSARKCDTTVNLLTETVANAAKLNESAETVSALVCAAHVLECFEIASYVSLVDCATVLGYEQAAALLMEILEEESKADDALARLCLDSNTKTGLKSFNQNGGSLGSRISAEDIIKARQEGARKGAKKYPAIFGEMASIVSRYAGLPQTALGR